MSSSSNKSTGRMINPDLIKERSRTTFYPTLLTNLLDGGSSTRTKRRQQLESIIANDPSGIFSNDDNPYLHRTERHVRALAKTVRLLEICDMLGLKDALLNGNNNPEQQEDFNFLCQAIADDPSPLALHWVMFVPNILSLADEEQKALWLPLIRNWEMIGCYAQTELGHGSNVRALETTATFQKKRRSSSSSSSEEGDDDDEDEDEDGCWIIHSPTITSYKFWPGTLGRTANHAVVIARLIDGNSIDRGIHNFLVQLRDIHTHELLEGIETGDIGPKIGYNNMDNGYAKFTSVIIPRKNMLMKFATVDRYGKYTKKVGISDAMSKVSYITMMQVRAHIINESHKKLAEACTIAVRYSCVRKQGYDEDHHRQSRNKENGGSAAGPPVVERCILDYKTQQYRLLTRLATSYCFFFTGKRVLDGLSMIEQRLLNNSANTNNTPGDGGAADVVVVVTKEQISDIHASTSCLKSFCTDVAAEGIEDCRRACGGHGFLHSSGLPELYTTYLQNPTVEGDNHMLPQQAVRVLLKLVQAIIVVVSGGGGEEEEKLLGVYRDCECSYLIRPIQEMLLSGGGDGGMTTKNSFAPQTIEEMMDLPTLLKAFQHRAARLLLNVSRDIQNGLSNGGKTMQTTWNDSLIDMARVSRAHALCLIMRNAMEGIDKEEQRGELLGQAEIQVLRELTLLFGLYWMEKYLGDFLEDGYVSSPHQTSLIRKALLHLLEIIRPNALGLVDARDISDFRLKSTLGRYDGNVYPAILEAAKRDPLNAKGIGPGYEEHLKKIIVGDGTGGVGNGKRGGGRGVVGNTSGTASRL